LLKELLYTLTDYTELESVEEAPFSTRKLNNRSWGKWRRLWKGKCSI